MIDTHTCLPSAGRPALRRCARDPSEANSAMRTVDPLITRRKLTVTSAVFRRDSLHRLYLRWPRLSSMSASSLHEWLHATATTPGQVLWAGVRRLVIVVGRLGAERACGGGGVLLGVGEGTSPGGTRRHPTLVRVSGCRSGAAGSAGGSGAVWWRRSRLALPTTDSELSAMAAAASIGLSRRPSRG